MIVGGDSGWYRTSGGCGGVVVGDAVGWNNVTPTPVPLFCTLVRCLE